MGFNSGFKGLKDKKSVDLRYLRYPAVTTIKCEQSLGPFITVKSLPKLDIDFHRCKYIGYVWHADENRAGREKKHFFVSFHS